MALDLKTPPKSPNYVELALFSREAVKDLSKEHYEVVPKTWWQRLLWKMLRRSTPICVVHVGMLEQITKVVLDTNTHGISTIVAEACAIQKRFGHRPEAVYVGPKQLTLFMREDIARQIAPDVQKHGKPFYMGFSVYGLKFHMVPYMDGILIL